MRHYQGSLPGGPKAWTCPSCGAENGGPLEGGCAQCGAGKDAKKVDPPPTARTLPLVGSQLVEAAFARWRDANFSDTEPARTISIARDAFMAAIDWVQAGGLATKNTPPNMFDPGDARTFPLEDPVVRATLAAALAFYIDNQLAYGPIPGQLALHEARDLLAQLQPTEESVPSSEVPQ